MPFVRCLVGKVSAAVCLQLTLDVLLDLQSRLRLRRLFSFSAALQGRLVTQLVVATLLLSDRLLHCLCVCLCTSVLTVAFSFSFFSNTFSSGAATADCR